MNIANSSQYDTKIQRILTQFLEPNFKIKNDVYLNSLLTYFNGSADIGCNLSTTSLINYQIFPAWIRKAVEVWETDPDQCDPQIVAFALNLLAIISKDETTFQDLILANIYDRMLTVSQTPRNASPSIKLAFIKVVSAFLDHTSGVQFIITTNSYWFNILQYALSNQTIYITKEGNKFISKLIDKSINIDRDFCRRIVETILSPLKNNAFLAPNLNSTSIEISDEEVYKQISPTLNLLADVLEVFLQNIATKDFQFVQMLTEEYKLEDIIDGFLHIAQSPIFYFELDKVLYILLFFEAGIAHCNQTCKSDSGAGGSTFDVGVDKSMVNNCQKKLYNMFVLNINKGLNENFLKICYLGHVYAGYISAIMPTSYVCVEQPAIEGDNVTCARFEHQMLTLQILPIFSVSVSLIGFNGLKIDELREEFFTKLLKIITIPTLRIAYLWRDALLKQIDVFPVATTTLQLLIRSKKYFKREEGTLVFQVMIYVLCDFVTALKEHPEKIDVVSKESSYVALLLDTIAMFIVEFQLSWRDSVETTTVMNTAFDFLSFPPLQPNLVVKALKLVDLSISKYMAPNLALLIDVVNDSTMAFMGPLLYAKLHDASWEVRDSALEVLCTISHNANTKFPSFQKVLLDSQLPSLIVKVALRDGESFVRATALKCLQEMVQVEDFWKNLLENFDLNVKLIEILENESEGIVRKEAAELMGIIYEHHSFPAELITKVYDMMTHAATADMHWEVKVTALNFWDKVIQEQLQQQGMIDGTFPSVVFSKENRKIVTLNEVEVQRRLMKILRYLSEYGCLFVLMQSVNDECDLEVSKSATRLVQRFVELLKKYNLNSTSAVSISSGRHSMETDARRKPSIEDEFNTTVNSAFTTSEYSQMTENVINDIINSRDVNLLQDVYNPNEESTNQIRFHKKQVVDPNEFLQFAQIEFEARLAEKQKWLKDIDDLGSLLDDILRDYEHEDVTSMDCY